VYRFMSKYSSDHYLFVLSRSLVTHRHRCVITDKVVNDSLRKICHYQQNLPQHYYLLDILVPRSRSEQSSERVVSCEL